jgi:hypothetical protein
MFEEKIARDFPQIIKDIKLQIQNLRETQKDK